MANPNITGFNIGGENTQIDYNSLVNKPEQVQPDWNETDETSGAFIKNKPFYGTTKTIDVIKDKTITIASDTYYGACGGSPGSYSGPQSDFHFNGITSIKTSDNYVVTINGVSTPATVGREITASNTEYCLYNNVIFDSSMSSVTKIEPGGYFLPIDQPGASDYALVQFQHFGYASGTTRPTSITISIQKIETTVEKAIPSEYIAGAIPNALKNPHSLNIYNSSGTSRKASYDGSSDVTFRDSDTTYSFAINDGKLVITPSFGTKTTLTLPSGGGDSLWSAGSKGTNSIKTVGATDATNDYAVAEGNKTTASGLNSHAEGQGSIASGRGSHAEGDGTTASGRGSHAEGSGTTAEHTAAHAEGRTTTASGDSSHAEGNGTTASGEFSHAEGDRATASGSVSHAEGLITIASAEASHAEGFNTLASSENQHVFGKSNIEDPNNKYVEIVGNGEEDARSNARFLDWKGNEWLAGGLVTEDGVYIKSSTEGSSKYFKISVDDSGTITATEATPNWYGSQGA